jgi:hypothetical protein
VAPHHDRVLFRVYEADDGFRGSYDEVVAHEAMAGASVAWHEPHLVKQHVKELQDELAKHQAEADQLKALIAAHAVSPAA